MDSPDVVVVGGGAAGLAAALAALDHGASVTVLERAPELGGTSAKAHGYAWFPDNDFIRADGREDPKPDALRYMARLTAPERYDPSHPDLGLTRWEYAMAERFFDRAGSVLRALTQAGVRFAQVDLPDHYAHLPENRVPRGRVVQPQRADGGPGWGSDTTKQLAQAIRRRGGTLRINARVRTVRSTGQGSVSGVELDAGAPIAARRAVVFASGGFAQSPELRAELLAAPTFGSGAVAEATGDLIHIARGLGAPLRSTAYPWMCPVVLERGLRNAPDFQPTYTPPGDSMLYVNRSGWRTMDEKAPYNESTRCFWRWDPAALQWPDLFQFMVWDQPCQRRFASDIAANPIAPAGGDDAHVVHGRTLTELAHALRERCDELPVRVPIDDEFESNLKTTVQRFNELAAGGRDRDFGRGEIAISRAMNSWFGSAEEPAAALRPLAPTGPYHATIMAPGMLDTKGGPATNVDGRILGAGERPIPGLLGAGNCVASPSRAAYWAPGAPIGTALTYGYLAGAAAARTHATT